MKKFFAFLAAALLVVACGGSKEEPKSIEDQMLDHIAKIEKAVEAGDVEAVEAASEAFDEWGYSLSEDQMMEAIEAMVKHEERITKLMLACEAMENGADEYYDEWDDEDYEDYDDEDYEDYDYEDYDDEDYDDEDEWDDEDYDDEW